MKIVIITGFNSAGKTTLAENFVKDDYIRINRDTIGGKLSDLPKFVELEVKKGNTNLVLDNTYVNKENRKSIIECGKKLGIEVHCLWLSTSFENAQFNACQRMLRKTGKLLMPEDFKNQHDPNLFPPVALFSYKNNFEKPTLAEGFNSVEEVKFVRKEDPTYKNKALILDYDGTLRTSKGNFAYPIIPEEVEILPNRVKKLTEYKQKGYLLLGVSNQSGIAKGNLTLEAANKCFARTNELLGFDIDYLFCPHKVPPISCYCRKPQVGLGVVLIEKYKLTAKNSIFVGDMTTDKTFATRCGFQFIDQKDFF